MCGRPSVAAPEPDQRLDKGRSRRGAPTSVMKLNYQGRRTSTLSRCRRPFRFPMIVMRFTLAILCVLLSTAAFAQQREQGSKTWAVVIGISKYQKLPGGQQLQFADRDATLFAETVEKKGVSPQNVRLLTSAEATTAAVKSAIGNWLARSASESDTVLIFFSGHGMVEREFGEAYLLGYDSDPKDPYATALSVTE